MNWKLLLERQINAIASADYHLFLKEGTDDFRHGMNLSAFKQLSEYYGPKFESGYTLEYLTQLNQQGFKVYLWKVIYSDGEDDSLLRLVINEDKKITGFWIQ